GGRHRLDAYGHREALAHAAGVDDLHGPLPPLLWRGSPDTFSRIGNAGTQRPCMLSISRRASTSRRPGEAAMRKLMLSSLVGPPRPPRLGRARRVAGVPAGRAARRAHLVRGPDVRTPRRRADH